MSVNTFSRQEIIAFLVAEKALRFGEFTLKSGAKSPFFINLGDICSGSALQYVGQAFAQKIKQDFGSVQILFGPPYKGIALITATAMAWQQLYGEDVFTCYNRKEAKAHGEAGMFVGKMPQKSDRIIVIDDVLTTGGTKLEAIQMVESTFDVMVQGIVVTVDRRLKGQDSGLGSYPLSALVTLQDVVDYLREKGDSRAQLMADFYEGRYHG